MSPQLGTTELVIIALLCGGGIVLLTVAGAVIAMTWSKKRKRDQNQP